MPRQDSCCVRKRKLSTTDGSHCGQRIPSFLLAVQTTQRARVVALKFERPFARMGSDDKAHSLDAIRARLAQLPDLWIFSYGSLMWRPCYPIAESRRGQLKGFARRLCVWTIEARGTPNEPGLGLGLEADATAHCAAMVHRVHKDDQQDALAALWAREMLTGIYTPCWMPIVTTTATTGATTTSVVTALAFIVDPDHPQYAGQLSPESQAERVMSAVGVLGSCLEYVEQTVRALDELGIHDRQLHEVLDNATRLTRASAKASKRAET